MLQGLYLRHVAARDRLQPGGRPALRPPRPAGADRMSAASHDAAEVTRRIHGEGGGMAGARAARARRAHAHAPRADRLRAAGGVPDHGAVRAVPRAAGPERGSSFSTSAAQNLASPSSAHLLGTDESGRDVLSELLYAARISLSVGLAAALISTILGAIIGIVAGYFGGWVDRILMAIDDWVLVIPFIPTAIVIASLLGRRRADSWPLGRESVLVLVIGALGWAGTSRIVRSQVLTLKERDYVQRARVLGSSDRTIMARHILPGVLPLVLANAVLYISISVLAETTLAFLGLGDPQNFSWGQMLNSAYDSGAMTQAKWAYFIPPGLCVTLLAMALQPRRLRARGDRQPDAAGARMSATAVKSDVAARRARPARGLPRAGPLRADRGRRQLHAAPRRGARARRRVGLRQDHDGARAARTAAERPRGARAARSRSTPRAASCCCTGARPRAGATCAGGPPRWSSRAP